MNVMTSITTQAGPIGFSTADFWQMTESGAFEDMWVELIEGNIQRMPPPGNTHGAAQIDVIAQLLGVFDNRPEGDDYLGLSLTRFGEPLAVPGGEAGTTVTLS